MDLYKRLFVISKSRLSVAVIMFTAVFALLVALSFALLSLQAVRELQEQLTAQLKSSEQLKTPIRRTVADLVHFDHQSDYPCSEDFMQWLKSIAFLPDGIHEIIYEDDTISCSVANGVLAKRISLGKPDVVRKDLDIKLWLDRSLDIVGHPDLSGSFMHIGYFTLVLPPLKLDASIPHWLNSEYTMRGTDGERYTLAGIDGVNERYPNREGVGFSFKYAAFWGYRCDDFDLTCVTLEAPLVQFLKTYHLTAGLVLVLLVIVSILITNYGIKRFLDFFTLPERFTRTFCKNSLLCHYQPLLSLRTGEIEGVEVLVRWRDMDGSIVFPDKFLPVVAERDLSRELTELVVENALSDLSTIHFDVPNPRVNINVFPEDFDAEWLSTLLKPLQESPQGYQPVVEIVETSDLPIEETCTAILQLRENGIKTYIDDFGVGYSSLHYLSRLGADGVKLDRFFAMSPPGSLSSKMLFSVIELVAKTGLKLVVEGLECQERLMSLSTSGKVDAAQGYFISPPLPRQQLEIFLANWHDQQMKQDTYFPIMHQEISAKFAKHSA